MMLQPDLEEAATLSQQVKMCILWMHCAHGEMYGGLTQYTWSHVVSSSEFGVWWYKSFPPAQHRRALETEQFTKRSI